ncbi:hypothetical protein SAY87_005810 [Trapa incisa]|uniref:Protein SPT2 homolog n=1 Tax=Trapa incisa TaxID=236973 RepID=A0AAN7K720_9MYRT|nr:hypothetical protein SAY87_005810 [Trapa incisa]
MGRYEDDEYEDYDDYAEEEYEQEEDEYEEVKEDPKPTKEELEYLQLRQKLKESIRKRMKKEASGSQKTMKDSYGSFFGPAKPVIAPRVIEESKPFLENQQLASYILKTHQNGNKNLSRRPGGSKPGVRPQVPRISELKRKAQKIKDNRDYSFLLSEDAELPASPKLPPVRNLLPACSSDGRSAKISSQSGGRSSAINARHPNGGQEERRPGSANGHTNPRPGFTNGHLNPSPGSVTGHLNSRPSSASGHLNSRPGSASGHPNSRLGSSGHHNPKPGSTNGHHNPKPGSTNSHHNPKPVSSNSHHIPRSGYTNSHHNPIPGSTNSHHNPRPGSTNSHHNPRPGSTNSDHNPRQGSTNSHHNPRQGSTNSHHNPRPGSTNSHHNPRPGATNGHTNSRQGSYGHTVPRTGSSNGHVNHRPAPKLSSDSKPQSAANRKQLGSNTGSGPGRPAVSNGLPPKKPILPPLRSSSQSLKSSNAVGMKPPTAMMQSVSKSQAAPRRDIREVDLGKIPSKHALSSSRPQVQAQTQKPPKQITSHNRSPDRRPKKRPSRPFPDDDDDDSGAAAISMIRKMFGYNPRKFVGRDEDDSDMEANFEDIMREEKRSARIAREEDEEQLRMIEEEERREQQVPVSFSMIGTKMGGYEDAEYIDYDDYEEGYEQENDSEVEDEFEEEKEDPKPTKEEMEYLELRQKLKESIRKRMKKEASGSQEIRKDNYGSFFGPSKPVIAHRVIQESKSLLEDQDLVSRILKARQNGNKSSSARHGMPKPGTRPQAPIISEMKRKVQKIKDTRDYSFLLSEDADLPDLPKQPLAQSLPSHSSDTQTSKVAFQSSRLSPRSNVRHTNGVREERRPMPVLGQANSKSGPSNGQSSSPRSGSSNRYTSPRLGYSNSHSNPRAGSSNGHVNPVPGPSKLSSEGKHQTSANRKQLGSNSGNGPGRPSISSGLPPKKPILLPQKSSLQNTRSSIPSGVKPQTAKIQSAPKFQVEPRKNLPEADRGKFPSKPAMSSSRPQTQAQTAKTQNQITSHDRQLDKRPRKRPSRPFGDDDDDGATAISMIRKMFGYNPQKFAGRDEDDRDMEANFDDILLEEKRSARIARKEDDEQLRLIEEEDRRERMRKMAKKRKMG